MPSHTLALSALPCSPQITKMLSSKPLGGPASSQAADGSALVLVLKEAVLEA